MTATSSEGTERFMKSGMIFFLTSLSLGAIAVFLFVYPSLYVSSGNVSQFTEYFLAFNVIGPIFSTAVTFLIFYHITGIAGRIERIKTLFLIMFLGIYSGGVLSLVMMILMKAGTSFSLPVVLFTELAGVSLWIPMLISGIGGFFARRLRMLKAEISR